MPTEFLLNLLPLEAFRLLRDEVPVSYFFKIFLIPPEMSVLLLCPWTTLFNEALLLVNGEAISSGSE